MSDQKKLPANPALAMRELLLANGMVPDQLDEHELMYWAKRCETREIAMVAVRMKADQDHVGVEQPGTGAPA